VEDNNVFIENNENIYPSDEPAEIIIPKEANHCVSDVNVDPEGQVDDPALSEFHELYDSFADDEVEEFAAEEEESEDENNETGRIHFISVSVTYMVFDSL
jgi:hypothetical protein